MHRKKYVRQNALKKKQYETILINYQPYLVCREKDNISCCGDKLLDHSHICIQRICTQKIITLLRARFWQKFVFFCSRKSYCTLPFGAQVKHTGSVNRAKEKCLTLPSQFWRDNVHQREIIKFFFCFFF